MNEILLHAVELHRPLGICNGVSATCEVADTPFYIYVTTPYNALNLLLPCWAQHFFVLASANFIFPIVDAFVLSKLHSGRVSWSNQYLT